MDKMQKLFEEIYTGMSIPIEKADKTLRKKLEAYRNQMTIDFYYLTEENISEFSKKYMDTSKITFPQDAHLSRYFDNVGESFVLLFYQQEHGIFKRILDKVVDNNFSSLTEAEITHINENLFGRVIRKDNSFGRYYPFGDFTIITGLYEAIFLIGRGEKIFARCEASDCSNLFIPYNSGKGQRYCSNNCRVKSFYRVKKQLTTVENLS